MVAKSKNKWHTTLTEKKVKSSQKDSKVHINCDELFQEMKNGEMYLSMEKKTLDQLEITYITIVYEDDLLPENKQQQTMDIIFDYLSLPSVLVKTNLVRTTSDNMSDFIENYDELVKIISRTKYAKFLC